MHDREQLTAILAQFMTKCVEMGVEGAALDPGYEGITSTLEYVAHNPVLSIEVYLLFELHEQ